MLEGVQIVLNGWFILAGFCSIFFLLELAKVLKDSPWNG